MRALSRGVLAGGLVAIIIALAAPVASADPPPGETPGAVPAGKHVKVTVDRSTVSLPGHTLVVALNQPAQMVHLKVIGESGAVLSDADIAFHGEAAGTPLSCSWTPSSGEAVARIEVIGHATTGYWAGVAITPWKAEVPHEEVNFETDSDVIRPSETPKLEASLKAIGAMTGKRSSDLGNVVLYIVGHTDTVGTAAHNFALSQRRARSIGGWFKQHGVRVPVAYEGFGEAALRVPTADEVDEPRNRRVDYVLAAESPPLPAASLGWHAL
jgi:outer membrane protein OmpA-like peptidoglycan-associated protein